VNGKRFNRQHFRVAALFAFASLFFAPSALAATPAIDIASSGPLDHVWIGNELSCQVGHTGDTSLEFFPPSTVPGDCGTHLFDGTTLFAPDYNSHGGTATSSLGARTPFTPVSQSAAPTGLGTSASPFTVVTSVDAGSTGLHLSETDSYVVGQESYRTDITVSNTGQSAQNVILYRAGDCFLQGSDSGFGGENTTEKSTGCAKNANNSPAGRIEQWFPLTSGNNYLETCWPCIWQSVATHAAFPDSCQCTTEQDNGAGLSWSFSVPGGGSVTKSHFTTFSPTGQTGPPPAGPAASINDVSKNEGDSGTTDFTFTVTLDRADPTNPVTIDYATANGSAVEPGDYASTSGTITFPPNTTTQTITVHVNGDTTPEPDETFFVNLTNPSANAAITDPQGQGTIKNDDLECAPGNNQDSSGCEEPDLSSLSLRRGAVVPVVVSCPRYRWKRCTGVVRLEAKRGRHTVTLAKRSYHKLLRGTKRRITLKLTKRGRRAVAASGRLKVRVIAADRVRVGKRQKLHTSRRQVAKLKLRARRAR
jgi:Calx-beta domain